MMEYSKQTAPKNSDKPRSLEFGSVFLPQHVKKNEDVESGERSINVSEEIIQQGMAWVIRTKDLDEEPKFYADLLKAESISRYAKRGVYSPMQPSPNDVADVSHVSYLLSPIFFFFFASVSRFSVVTVNFNVCNPQITNDKIICLRLFLTHIVLSFD